MPAWQVHRELRTQAGFDGGSQSCYELLVLHCQVHGQHPAALVDLDVFEMRSEERRFVDFVLKDLFEQVVGPVTKLFVAALGLSSSCASRAIEAVEDTVEFVF